MPRAIPFAIMILFTLLACMGVELFIPASTDIPAESSGITPYSADAAPSKYAETSTPAPIISTPQVYPPWVADFSDPILKSLQDVSPVFQDDFPPICIDEKRNWKVCSTPEARSYYQQPLAQLPLATARATLDLQPDLQKGYYLLNKGWFYIVPDSIRNPYYARVDNGALFLKLPEGKEKKDFKVYNPYLRYKNFALQFDFEFKESQPDDALRFQFNSGAGQSAALDLSKNKTWAFHWGPESDSQTRSGVYEYFTPEERIPVVIIMRGTECAVYVNDDPLDYFSDCRPQATIEASPQAVSFHLLGEPGYFSTITIDNVKMWDLDKLP